MKKSLLSVLLVLATSAPSLAQEWGSDYNMGSIGVTGGVPANGTISIDCAESGNGIVPQGALTIFVKPAVRAIANQTDPKSLDFAIDGTRVQLPVEPDAGDGFVFSKTADTAAAAADLIDQLKTGKALEVSAAGGTIARIDLDGAAAALDGVEACLVP